jgi:putative membrane protein
MIMTYVGQVAALIAALIHVYIFVIESVLFTRPDVQAKTFRVPPEDVAAARPWAFNQGFYNLFLAIGTIIGLILIHTAGREAGLALVGLACGCMLAAALVLLSSNPKLLRSAAVQGAAPLIALAFIFI